MCHGWSDNDILQLFVKIFHKLLESKIRFEKTRDAPLIFSTAFSTNTKFRASCQNFLTHCNLYTSWKDKTGSAKARCDSFKKCLETIMGIGCNNNFHLNIILPPPIIIEKMEIQENNRKCSGGYRYLIPEIIEKFEHQEGCRKEAGEKISEFPNIIEIIQEYHHYNMRFWTVTPEKPQQRHRDRYHTHHRSSLMSFNDNFTTNNTSLNSVAPINQSFDNLSSNIYEHLSLRSFINNSHSSPTCFVTSSLQSINNRLDISCNASPSDDKDMILEPCYIPQYTPNAYDTRKLSRKGAFQSVNSMHIDSTNGTVTFEADNARLNRNIKMKSKKGLSFDARTHPYCGHRGTTTTTHTTNYAGDFAIHVRDNTLRNMALDSGSTATTSANRKSNLVHSSSDTWIATDGQLLCVSYTNRILFEYQWKYGFEYNHQMLFNLHPPYRLFNLLKLLFCPSLITPLEWNCDEYNDILHEINNYLINTANIPDLTDYEQVKS